jgi:chemotaxis protein histidine kinase CheA
MEDFELKFKIETLDEIEDNFQSILTALNLMSSHHQFIEKYDLIFREFHSAKGNSQAAGFIELGEVLHRLESHLPKYKI